jgi:hypothetical protein
MKPPSKTEYIVTCYLTAIAAQRLQEEVNCQHWVSTVATNTWRVPTATNAITVGRCLGMPGTTTAFPRRRKETNCSKRRMTTECSLRSNSRGCKRSASTRDESARVEAGSNTSTVTLRVVGGGKGQQHIQKTDPSSRKRGRPTKQDRNCQTVINIWSLVPDGARHQDLLTDWPSVAMWLWLDFDLRRVSS